jgi:hypothetical protein
VSRDTHDNRGGNTEGLVGSLGSLYKPRSPTYPRVIFLSVLNAVKNNTDECVNAFPYFKKKAAFPSVDGCAA